jgi:hypothetical protein
MKLLKHRKNTKRRNTTKKHKRRNKKLKGGDLNLKDMITMGILCWKSPLTIKNSLESYKNNNLFSMVTPSIYFQERDASSDDLAKEYGIENVHGTSENIGIMSAFIEIIKNVKTPYFIFTECDFELVHDESTTKKIFEDCIKLMREEDVDYVRNLLPVDNYYTFKYTLELLQNPDFENLEQIIPNLFTIKNSPDYNYKWYITTFEHSVYTNNVFIIDTSFLKETILQILEKNISEHPKLETVFLTDDINSIMKNYKVAAGNGLFKHNRLDR